MHCLILFLISICSFSCAYSHNVPMASYGFSSYGQETLESLKVYGGAQLKGTIILRHLDVYGELKANDAKIGSLAVYGAAELTDCTIKHETAIHGSLAATDSKFQGPLFITSTKIVLSGCTTESIVIGKDTPNAYTIVELKNGTVVKGDLTFENGLGEVIQPEGTKILGKIQGLTK